MFRVTWQRQAMSIFSGHGLSCKQGAPCRKCIIHYILYVVYYEPGFKLLTIFCSSNSYIVSCQTIIISMTMGKNNQLINCLVESLYIRWYVALYIYPTCPHYENSRSTIKVYQVFMQSVRFLPIYILFKTIGAMWLHFV